MCTEESELCQFKANVIIDIQTWHLRKQPTCHLHGQTMSLVSMCKSYDPFLHFIHFFITIKALVQVYVGKGLQFTMVKVFSNVNTRASSTNNHRNKICACGDQLKLFITRIKENPWRMFLQCHNYKIHNLPRLSFNNQCYHNITLKLPLLVDDMVVIFLWIGW